MENEELVKEFFKREHQRIDEFASKLNLQPLFDWITGVVGFPLNFTYEIVKGYGGKYEVHFTSQNIVDKVGIMGVSFFRSMYR